MGGGGLRQGGSEIAILIDAPHRPQVMRWPIEAMRTDGGQPEVLRVDQAIWLRIFSRPRDGLQDQLVSEPTDKCDREGAGVYVADRPVSA